MKAVRTSNRPTTIPLNRRELVRQGQRLEYFTIGYNSLEGLVSIVAGAIAGSVSLIGFGLDSIIEVIPGRPCSGGSTTIWTAPGVKR
jgi:hypothetical protein